jgi:hypothetical protein
MAESITARSNQLPASDKQKRWQLDQIARSHYFHARLHEWGLLEIQDEIDKVEGDRLAWNAPDERIELGISEVAWNKIIHQGIKPVRIFAHPTVLISQPRAVSYYRTLSMVSRKSTPNSGASTIPFETTTRLPPLAKAQTMARMLNTIISQLVETDGALDIREFEMWHGMAAGAQAQGAWNNDKGKDVEKGIKSIVNLRLEQRDLLANSIDGRDIFSLKDGRRVVFASEPDIAIYTKDNQIDIAIEIKGGIDTAGVHERYGAIGKSFEKPKKSNPSCVTILLIQAVSLTLTATELLNSNSDINHWFTIEDVLLDSDMREEFLTLLGI